MSNGWSLITGSVAATGNLVAQINFPKEALVIATFGQIVIDFLIRLLLVLAVYLIYGLSPSFLILLFPLYVLPLFLLTLGLGYITALLKVIAHDIQSFLDVGLSFFLFLMPIMYTMPEKGFLSRFNIYNPVYYLINTPRDLIITGTINNSAGFLLSSLLAVAVFIGGWFIFYIAQSKIAERV
jgi:lipopolysaccharide transport system permease protein